MVTPRIPIKLLPALTTDMGLRRGLRLFWILKCYAPPRVKLKAAHKLLRKYGCTKYEIAKYLPWLIEKRLLGKDAVNYYIRAQGDLAKLIEGNETTVCRSITFDPACLSDRKVYETTMYHATTTTRATQIAKSRLMFAQRRRYARRGAKALFMAGSFKSKKQVACIGQRAIKAVEAEKPLAKLQAKRLSVKFPLAALGDMLPGVSISTLSRIRKRAATVKGTKLKYVAELVDIPSEVRGAAFMSSDKLLERRAFVHEWLDSTPGKAHTKGCKSKHVKWEEVTGQPYRIKSCILTFAPQAETKCMRIKNAEGRTKVRTEASIAKSKAYYEASRAAMNEELIFQEFRMQEYKLRGEYIQAMFEQNHELAPIRNYRRKREKAKLFFYEKG